MKKILIITHSKDNQSIDLVSEALKQQDFLPIRLNTDLYPTDIQLIAEYIDGEQKLFLQDELGATHDLSSVKAIWYRRVRLGEKLKEIIEGKYLYAAIEETRRTFFGLLACLNLKAFTLGEREKLRYSEIKQLQLKVAESLGLNIPKTLFTNDVQAVQNFAQKCANGLITKMQTSFAIYEDGKENVVFTSDVTEESLAQLDGLKYCPMTFQEKIQKQIELRITIVGDQLFAAAVDSQVSEKSQTDWRKDGIGLLKSWVAYDLPADIQQKLLHFMDYFQLNYGAIDMIVTPENEYVFLEVNPAGEFFWLELFNPPGFAISKSIANVLIGKVLRRESITNC